MSAAGEQRTRDIAAKAAMFRAAMEAVFGLRVTLATPTRIYALSAEDWERYVQPRPNVAGYFAAHPFGSDLLFDADADDPRRFELMFHEYTHYVLRTLTSGRYPAFFDEGLAEVFSTATFSDGVVSFEPRPEYVAYLRRREWMPFERLLEIERRDAEYVDHTLAPAFYAQAWATMYYAVAADSAFGNRLLDYIRNLNSGVARDEAVEALIGDTIAHANREIARFVLSRRPPLPAAEIRVGGIADERSFVQRRLNHAESSLILAELMLRLGNRSEAALTLLRDVRGDENTLVRARINEGLAHLQAGDRERALGVLNGVPASAALPAVAAVALGRGLFELSVHPDRGAQELSEAQRRRLRRARALFATALHDPRGWIEATNGYVLASLALHQHEESLVELASKAYGAAPKSAELAVSLAILHDLQGRKPVARRYWREAARNLHEGPSRSRILAELAPDEVDSRQAPLSQN